MTAAAIAAPLPKPLAIGIVLRTVIRRAGGSESFARSMTNLTERAKGSFSLASESQYSRPISGAANLIPTEELSSTTDVALIWVTGAAIAGRPYTTACSPKRMILPGAVAVVTDMALESRWGGK